MLTEHIDLPKTAHMPLVIVYANDPGFVVEFYPIRSVAGTYATEAEARAVQAELRIRIAVLRALES